MKIETAMLLAAGRGERLIPLTNDCPKPLLPIQGKSFIEHNLEKCQAVGIKKVIINVCYLANKIIDTLGDGKKFDLDIEYSYEAEALGAGGGIRQALALLGEKPFLLLSSDIWTDFPLEKFFTPDWSLENNLIHAVLTNKAPHQKGDFDLVDHQLHLSEHPKYIYGSIAIIDPQAFSQEAPGKASLMPAFSKAIHEKRATGEYYKNIVNVNTVDEYTHLI